METPTNSISVVQTDEEIEMFLCPDDKFRVLVTAKATLPVVEQELEEEREAKEDLIADKVLLEATVDKAEVAKKDLTDDYNEQVGISNSAILEVAKVEGERNTAIIGGIAGTVLGFIAGIIVGVF